MHRQANVCTDALVKSNVVLAQSIAGRLPVQQNIAADSRCLKLTRQTHAHSLHMGAAPPLTPAPTQSSLEPQKSIMVRVKPSLVSEVTNPKVNLHGV